jgi:hypothetical protein
MEIHATGIRFEMINCGEVDELNAAAFQILAAEIIPAR